ncbi:type III pantothenate kinase [Marinibactrum halimedae]|uniref:Type III pantothenate kinase n=1 Tax=Marinibactrum halimedae TaxID=1444977 RepID=A0AA37T7K7_9GAMM|nr:type III pantothenate kinase [Marinibactrum halimedae]MCD9461291.1 type III pantothenate kinase [Marinibactrum halimedae]GLS27226.1 type III pantothenate kinase [Marinibactrum halimedae]
MILEVDQGNTRTKWRIKQSEVVIRQGATSACLKGMSELESFLKAAGEATPIKLACISSVANEDKKKLLASVLSKWCKEIKFVSTQKKYRDLKNGYSHPESLGVDRWLAMIAAFKAGCGKPCLVVDAGTAITVDLIADEGCHQGGYIGPGLSMMSSSLNTVTASAQTNSLVDDLKGVPGRSTDDAIKEACSEMALGLVLKSLEYLRAFSGPNVGIFITGGDGVFLSRVISDATYSKDLVLDGISALREDGLLF